MQLVEVSVPALYVTRRVERGGSNWLYRDTIIPMLKAYSQGISGHGCPEITKNSGVGQTFQSAINTANVPLDT